MCQTQVTEDSGVNRTQTVLPCRKHIPVEEMDRNQRCVLSGRGRQGNGMQDGGAHSLGKVREGFSEEASWSPDLCKVHGRVMASLQGLCSRQRLFSISAPPSTIHLVAQVRNLGVLMYPFADPSPPKFIRDLIHFLDLRMQLQTRLPGECDQNFAGTQHVLPAQSL